MTATTASLSLYHLLEPEVLAAPYPLYRRLREEDPVHWDPYLHAWVVTGYADVATVLQRFVASRTPSPEKLSALGLDHLVPIARVMVEQMLFLDPPAHGRIRRIAAAAFTSRRVELLRAHIREIADALVDRVVASGEMDVIGDFANPLPGIVTAEMFGLPRDDHRRLKAWSEAFAEMLGNFQHNPERASDVLRSLEEMTAYFHEAVVRQLKEPGESLVQALATAEVDGDRLTEDEVVANLIILMVGGQETSTNLIGNGLLTLLRHPEDLERLREDLSLIPTAIEELLRYESPIQQTARLVPEAVELGDKQLMKDQAVIAVMGAANRDPERFADPDHLDIARSENRHLAFGGGAHLCFGAPLARIEGQVALETILARLPGLRLGTDPITWRPNLTLRGLSALHVAFS
jgi:pimeloyl-[acyl-carrier protein] synthase